MGGLGAVGASSIFGLVRRAGALAAMLPTFVLVSCSRMQIAQQYRGNGHFLSAASSSRRETMVGGSLTRASALHVGVGVGGAAIASGSRARPTHSCDGWVGDLGAVGASSIFGWIRRPGAFAAVLPTFSFSFKNAARATVPWQWPLPQRSVVFATYGNGRRRPGEGFGFACRRGCQWGYHRAWIVCSPIAFVDFSLVDLIFISSISTRH